MQRQNSQITMDVVDEPNDENSKKIVDNVAPSLPEEPLLGSFTTNPLAKEEKGIQIRSSARVFKKMKLGQEQDKKNEESNQLEVTLSSPNAEHPMIIIGNVEKAAEHEGKGQSVRSNTRAVKKVKHDESKGKKDEPKKEPRKWTYGEKLLFFEAVNEFGRDFENVQQYINSKLKKKGASDDQLKTKEHVRSCYMRTYHEVSRHVKFSDGVKKVVQELYAIINYGELYKRLGVITEKGFIKLSELIYRGETCIRVKGKNNRIKTPMCKALIKLNQLDTKYEEVRLPNRVTVELRPKDMTSFLKVQCVAQNPRLRTTLPIQKRLSSLIQCLNKRWKTVDAVNYEKSVVSSNPITREFVPSKQDIDEKLQLLVFPLRLSPPPEAKIELPSINISEYFTRQTICLTAYESRLGLDTFTRIKEMRKEKKKPKLDVELKVVLDKEVMDIKIEPVKLEEPEANIFYDNETDGVLADAVHDAVNTILSLQTIERQQSETSEPEDLPTKAEHIKEEIQKKDDPPEISPEDLEHIESIRKGWTELTSGSLTIGEIYLMYGTEAKLILEYSWPGDRKDEPDKPKRTAANFLEMWNDTFEESCETKQRNLTSSLSKLVSLAKLHYRQNCIKCPCGHVCGEKTIKNSTTPGGSRVRRGNTLVDNIASTTIKEENILAVVPDVPNGKVQVASGLFRQPINIMPDGPIVSTPTMEQQLSSIQRLKPKFCNRKGRRPRQKPIVVERKLPLLPNNLSGHQIVRMSIISQETPVIPVGPKAESMEVPTSFSTTQNPPQQVMDLQRVLTDDPEEDNNSNISTVPSSPSRILREGESEWMNAEVADYSLSSLLGHLESPVKVPTILNSNMATDLSSEVDAQLRSLMTESSLDFAASFADLAASVNDRKF